MIKLLLTTVAVFALTTVTAQDITFGAKAGVNLAAAAVGDKFEANTVTSFHIGATVEFAISDTFSVQPEVLYSLQGADVDDITINTNFINLPIMAKYYVTEGLSLEAGPQIGFLIKANAKEKDSSISFDVKDSFKSIDFGFNIGAGYKLESGLNFALRYNLGLTDISNSDNEDAKWKNRVLQFSVGYTFN